MFLKQIPRQWKIPIRGLAIDDFAVVESGFVVCLLNFRGVCLLDNLKSNCFLLKSLLVLARCSRHFPMSSVLKIYIIFQVMFTYSPNQNLKLTTVL